jgi:hypothetical protein
MIRQENINFVASKYAPNPTEVAYWIDLIVEALSAAQGKQLMNLINALTDRVTALETPEVPTV